MLSIELVFLIAVNLIALALSTRVLGLPGFIGYIVGTILYFSFIRQFFI